VVEAGSPNWQARAHSRLAQLHRIRRDYASARRCVEESNRLSEADDLDVAATTDQQAYALQTLGEIEQEQGNLDRAQELFEAALTIYEKTEETAGSANCYKGLGNILSTQGAYTKARERYEQALRIYEKVGDKQSASHCLRGISTTSWRLREYKTARKAALKSRDICQSIGDRQGEAACLNSLGLLAIVRGNHVETQRHLQASVAIYRDLGLEKRTASGLHNLGISYMESGKMVAARRSLEQALEIDQAVGSPHDQALDLGWLGKLHWLLKEYDAAVDYLDRALALDREIGGGEEEDWHLIWRTAVACEQDQPEEARIYLQRAERMFAQGSANLKMHDIAQWTARVYLIEGDSAAALAMAREALTAARAVEAPPATLAEILTLLGRTLGADVGSNCEEAGAHFEQALALLPDATPTAYLRATTLYHYGNHLASNGNKDQADAHCEEARAIFKRIGVPLEFMQ
jgi:tetratricopeptide (TPR) repeat protein